MAEIGRSKEHLQIEVEDSHGENRRVLFWQGAGRELPEDKFDLAFSVRTSNFKGKSELTLEWIGYRQKIEPAVEIRDRSNIQIIDFRNTVETEENINKLASQPGVVIFKEGLNFRSMPGYDRLGIKSANHLVIVTPPASYSLMKGIIIKSQPKKITLFAFDPRSDTIETFIPALVGLIKYSINKKNGYFDLMKISAALSHEPSTVEKGLIWLEARGEIRINKENMIISESHEKPNPVKIDQFESELRIMLDETAAFRAYYQRADAEALIAGNFSTTRKRSSQK